MSNLPVVAALGELQESNTDNRQRLQKSLRAGLLNVTNAVKSLETSLMNVMTAQLEEQQRQAFLDLERMREAARERQAAKQKDTKVDTPSELTWDMVKMPALLAIAASLTGLDDVIKALRVPAIMKNIGTAVTSVVDAVKAATRSVTMVADKIRDIKWLDLVPTIRFPDNTTFLERINTRAADLRTALVSQISRATMAIRSVFPLTEWRDAINLKVTNMRTAITTPITNAINNFKLAFDKFKLPDLPKLTWPKVVTDLKLPTIELPVALQNMKFPEMPNFTTVMDNVKTVLRGADGTGGLLGFFNKIGAFITDIPGLKGAFRLVGGPVTQALVSLIDFFTGFYKGFVGEGTRYDASTGRLIEDERTMVEKVLDGLEGGFIGVVKGITDAFDMLFIKLPAWLLEKVGAEDAAEFLRGFSLTELVDPIWNGIKGIFTFFTDPEFRREQVAKFKGQFTQMFENAVDDIKKFFEDLLESLNPKNWFSDDGEELTLLQRERAEVQQQFDQAAAAYDEAEARRLQERLDIIDSIQQKTLKSGMLAFERDVDGDGTAERFKTLQEAIAATKAETVQANTAEAKQLGTDPRGNQMGPVSTTIATDASVKNDNRSSTTYQMPASSTPNGSNLSQDDWAQEARKYGG